MTWKQVLAYLDDVIILAKDFNEGISHLTEVLRRFRKFNLKLKLKKCERFRTGVDLLGKGVSRDGINITEEKTNTILNWARPQDKKELQAFLGYMNYHREFIPKCAETADCLYQLVSANAKFEWTNEHQEVFHSLKKTGGSAEVLSFPTADDVFILDTDASDWVIGAELSQIQNGI